MEKLTIRGKYGEAEVYAAEIDQASISQITEMMNVEHLAKGNDIRIMPDVHAGKGSVVGFTSTMGESIIPNIVGVDIGCGMLTVNLGSSVDLSEKALLQLDDAILNKKIVPLGFNYRDKAHKLGSDFRFNDLTVKDEIKNKDRVVKSLGSLGSGNHFIEIAKATKSENYFLIIHTGSRNLGHQVAMIHQEIAIKELEREKQTSKNELDKKIEELKAAGRHSEIESLVKQSRSVKLSNLERTYAPLRGALKDNYLNDMKISQEYATLNRRIIAEEIIKVLFKGEKNLNKLTHFETIHNYINFEDNIIRKGAISAKHNEMILIPLNMRDGSLLCLGKGNPNWNKSAPHGAGRVMSRGQAKDIVELDDFIASMEGIHASTVGISTIDESPFAYKDKDNLIEVIGYTAEIIDQLKPIYNIKG